MSKFALVSDSPETHRAILERLQLETVAPKVFALEGINLFDISLSDEEVADCVRTSGIRMGKKLAHKHLVRLCKRIADHLTIHHTRRDGLIESFDDEGIEMFRLSEKGKLHMGDLRAASN